MLWRDEAFSAVAVRRPLLEMLNALRYDSAPPLHYLLAYAANSISPSALSLRMVTALVGTAMIPVAAALGRRVAGTRAGIFAAAAMAMMPVYVAQARDLRMYALAAALVLAACLLLWRALDEPSAGRLAAYFIVVVLAAHSQYFAVPAILCQLPVAWIALRPPARTILRVAGAGIAGLLALVPWVVIAAPQFQHAGLPFWVVPFDFAHILDLVEAVTVPNQAPGGRPLTNTLNTLRTVAGAAGTLGMVAVGLMTLRAKTEQRRRVAFVALSALVPTAALLLFSIRRPLFDSRYAAVMWVPLIPLIGVGYGWIASWSRRVAPAVAMVAVVALAADAFVYGPNVPNDDLRPAIAHLNQHVQPGDFVALNSPLPYFVVVYYEDPAIRRQTHVIADSVAWFHGTAMYEPDTAIPAIPGDVSGTIYILADVNSVSPPRPPGYNLQDSYCANGYCVEAWRR